MSKKFKISVEMAKYLLSKLEIMKNGTNKVLLEIGLQNAGDGVTCMAYLVNDRQMEKVGFTTLGIPKKYEDGEVYIKTAVKAADFCAYLSAYQAFNADIEFSCDEKELSLSVKDQANISLPVVAESEVEPRFEDDSKAIVAVVECKTSKLKEAIKYGGFIASTTADPSGLSDRVIFVLTPDKMEVHSAEQSAITSSSCEIKARFNNTAMAVYSLREKGATLNQESKVALFNKMQEFKTNQEGMIALAKTEAEFEPDKLSFALPTSSALVLQRIVAGSENLKITVSNKYLNVNADHVLASFVLAGKHTALYKTSVPEWDATDWNGKVIVDKDMFLTSLGILQLGSNNKGKAISLSVENGKLISKDRGSNITKTAILSSAGSLEGIEKHFNCTKLANIVSKMPGGNICFSMNDNPNMLLQIRNGDLAGADMSVKAYLAPVNTAQPIEEDTDEDEENTTDDISEETDE